MLTGFEIDMLAVGDADCILATGWLNNSAKRVLIDGGNKGDFDIVRAFLRQRGVVFLDAVVCTHPHDDHAGGLLELAKDQSVGIGSAFMHIPQRHVDAGQVEKALKLADGSAEADSMRKSLTAAKELFAAFSQRTNSIAEPFSGTAVEFLTVVGPSIPFYEELLTQFTDPENIKKIDAQQQSYRFWSAMHDHVIETLDTDLPPNPETTPENNSSAMLAILFGPDVFLFTADAGVPALQEVSERYKQLRNCHWMQIPHHGSRRNINPALAKHFSPKFAWVSADGNKKHPRRAVVNLFKQLGTVVGSTHYPTPKNLWKCAGQVPSRSDYGNLIPLYEASSPKLSPPLVRL